MLEKELNLIVKQVMQYYASLKMTYGQEENSQININESKQLFELRLVQGYFQPELVPFLQIQIKDNKIWIHYDGTDEFLADRLELMGVPKTQIVLGFLSPEERAQLDYAVE